MEVGSGQSGGCECLRQSLSRAADWKCWDFVDCWDFVVGTVGILLTLLVFCCLPSPIICHTTALPPLVIAADSLV